MTYEEFQKYLAKYGFVNTPISRMEYDFCRKAKLDLDATYGVACDVNAGLSFPRAFHIAQQRQAELDS